MPGAKAPGICLLSHGADPGGVGRSCARFVLGDQIIESEGFQLWVGAAGAGTWGQVTSGTSHFGPGHLKPRENPGRKRCSERADARTSHPGKPEIRRESWSRSRIVSALLSDAQGGCLPSMEPPNPDAHTIAIQSCADNPKTDHRNGSSPRDIRLHEARFMPRMNSSTPGSSRRWTRPVEAAPSTARIPKKFLTFPALRPHQYSE
jgi:hypothetical protein